MGSVNVEAVEMDNKSGDHMMTLTQFVGTLATITTIGQFLSGSLTAKRVWQLGSPGDLSPVPFIAGVLGASLWFLYGSFIHDTTIMYTNVAGITFNAFYVIVFYFYTQKKISLSRQILFVLTFITTVAIYVNSFGPTEEANARNQLGLICTVISLTCCASPLISLKHVMRTKSTETLPFPLIISVFFVCLLWWIYGVLIDDLYMQVTNCLGTLISVVQLSLFLVYPNSAHDHEKAGYSLKM